MLIQKVQDLLNTWRGTYNLGLLNYRDEILKLIAPSEEVQTSIIDWLQNGAKEVDANIQINNMKDSIQVTAPGKSYRIQNW